MYKRQGYALREQYPIDENCKPIEKYGQLGLFRAHEIPKIVPLMHFFLFTLNVYLM